MSISNKYEALALLFGDMLVSMVALWASLFLRFGTPPSSLLFIEHTVSFFPVFLALLTVFFLIGLYGKRALILRSRLPALLFKAELVSGVLAVCYFYLFPQDTVNPKTILALYLALSFLLELLWRLKSDRVLSVQKREMALLIGTDKEAEMLFNEVNGNPRYHITFVKMMAVTPALYQSIADEISRTGITLVVVDFHQYHGVLSWIASHFSGKVRSLKMDKLYEEVFDSVPPSLIGQSWFLENISVSSYTVYESLKRIMDIIIASVLGALSLVVYPLVYLAIKCNDRGAVFIRQERVGRHGAPIHILKFRTMSDSITLTPDKRITRVGKFLRSSRIDELPQLWNVFWGDLSIIGPRPELPELVEAYRKEIPYYTVRHSVAPGLSGWAQIHQDAPPKFALAVDQTKIKLSYDLFYLKNRSLFLDVVIALKTIRTLLSRSGV